MTKSEDEKAAVDLERQRERQAVADRRIAEIKTRLESFDASHLTRETPMDRRMAESVGCFDVLRHSSGGYAEVLGGFIFGDGTDPYLEIVSAKGTVHRVSMRRIGEWTLLRRPR